jgi:hypothetical protein
MGTGIKSEVAANFGFNPLLVFFSKRFGCNRSCCLSVQQEYSLLATQTLIGKASINTAIRATVTSFLFLDKPDTSSSGPGCLNIDMKTMRNAMITNSVPMISKSGPCHVTTVKHGGRQQVKHGDNHSCPSSPE